MVWNGGTHEIDLSSDPVSAHGRATKAIWSQNIDLLCGPCAFCGK
jgi:hypothetical protein